MAKERLVTGIVKSRVAVEAIVDTLLKRGYLQSDISMLMSDATRNKEFAVETTSQTAKGAGIGGAVGGVVGATLAALLVAAATITIPGIGLVIAGPIAAALAGAGAGGATGGLIGGLIGAGISEHRAKVYDAEVRGGGILIGVEAKTSEEADKLEKLFEDMGVSHVRQE